jgi:hypothetical protein
MPDLQQQIDEIKQRNARVEADKGWETSWVRRGFITLVTYIFAVLWLYIIKNDRPWLNALVPAIGYLLSTISLASVKMWWQKGRR